MLTDQRAVFRRLAFDESGALHPLGLLSYARFSAELYEYLDHFEELEGRAAAQADIEDWIKRTPVAKLQRLRRDTDAFFVTFALSYLEDVIDGEKQKAVEMSILNHVKQFTNSWKAFILNFAAGLAAAFVFAVILVGIYYVAIVDPSPVSLLGSAGESGS